MRWQVEDVRVADVVAVREDHVRRVEREHEDRAPDIGDGEPGEASHREHRPRHAELLPEIEPVHRRVIAQHRAWHVHHQCVAPVGLRDVEPEPVQRVDQAVGRIGEKPQRPKIPGVLGSPDRGTGQRQRHVRWRQQRAPSARRRKEQKQRQPGRQQNHGQVIAEAQRVDGEQQQQPSPGRLVGPPEPGQQRQRDEHQVERIDLGDHRLAPERVRRREEQRRADRRAHRSGQFRGNEHDEPARHGRGDG